MEKNHMEIPWHDYARQDGNILIDKAGLIEKASVIGSHLLLFGNALA